MIRKLTGITAILSLLYLQAGAQTEVTKSKPVAEIFTDFHYIVKDSLKTNGFGLNRAHLGYQYAADDRITARIIVNVGSPLDLAVGSVPRRYAMFREASIAYTENRLSINFGIVSTRIFSYQQKFWSKRYIAPEYQSIHGYGSVADLGMVVDYRVNDHITADLSLLNGEGYSNIQLDNSLKSAAGFTVQTSSGFAFRAYADIMRTQGVTQTTMIGFAGKKGDHYSIGGEASYKSNLDHTSGHNGWGFSGTGAIILSEKNEIFLRYDFSSSNIMAGEEEKWNYERDGSFVITGFQYTLNQYFRFALNYQTNFPYSSQRQKTQALFLNLHFRY